MNLILLNLQRTLLNAMKDEVNFWCIIMSSCLIKHFEQGGSAPTSTIMGGG